MRTEETELRACTTCGTPTKRVDAKAVCSCGDIYCKNCVAILTGEEIRAAIEDSARQGHQVSIQDV